MQATVPRAGPVAGPDAAGLPPRLAAGGLRQPRPASARDITDDAQLVEAAGHAVHLVAGSPTNLKITTREDLALAEAILKSRPKPKAPGPIHPFADEVQVVTACPTSAVRHRLAPPAAAAQAGPAARPRRRRPPQFRALVRDLTQLLFFEATHDLRLAPVTVQTPLASAPGHRLGERIGLVPILRAGLGMAEAILELVPDGPRLAPGAVPRPRDAAAGDVLQQAAADAEHRPVAGASTRCWRPAARRSRPSTSSSRLGRGGSSSSA